MNNSFGDLFKMTSFGESHGPALGCVVEGCPAGVVFNQDLLQNELVRRRPGRFDDQKKEIVSQRSEPDQVEILSGVFEGKTLGTPIAMMVRNQDARSEDYKTIEKAPRAGHADDVWKSKFGHVDPRGGGRSSGRETVARVMAGSVARMMLNQVHPELKILAFASQIGPFKLTKEDISQIPKSQSEVDEFVARFPSSQHHRVFSELKNIQAKGESWGGMAEIHVQNVPAGLGQPVFHKLKSDMAQAFLSLGATCGFELGEGLSSAMQAGTEFHNKPSVYGGERGGISTGQTLVYRVAFKPTSSILDVAKKGRHDPCIVPRAIPVLEAMTALVIADHVLKKKLDQI